MATTTPNFGWSVPTSTDLVKDGATAIETLGDAIDASLVDLKGGTTGQVLAKNSNTDMDFTWTAVDPLVILDAKGDLITATAADTPARLAVGTNGQTLVADSTASTGLKWASNGLTLVNTTTIGSAVSSVSLNSVFTSTYANYKVIIQYTNCSATEPTINLRLRASGSDNSASFSYQPRGWTNNSGTLAGFGTAGNTLPLGVVRDASYAWTLLELISPQLSTRTTGFTVDHYDPFNNNSWGYPAQHTASTSYDGFTIYPSSGTLTGGTIYVYGYGL